MKSIQDLHYHPFRFGTSKESEPEQKICFVAEPYEGRIQFGVWEAGPGELDLEFGWDESMSVVEGEVLVEDLTTGSSFRLGPGSLAVFLAGSRWRWQIPYKLKKVFTVIERQ